MGKDISWLAGFSTSMHISTSVSATQSYIRNCFFSTNKCSFHLCNSAWLLERTMPTGSVGQQNNGHSTVSLYSIPSTLKHICAQLNMCVPVFFCLSDVRRECSLFQFYIFQLWILHAEGNTVSTSFYHFRFSYLGVLHEALRCPLNHKPWIRVH